MIFFSVYYDPFLAAHAATQDPNYRLQVRDTPRSPTISYDLLRSTTTILFVFQRDPIRFRCTERDAYVGGKRGKEKDRRRIVSLSRSRSRYSVCSSIESNRRRFMSWNRVPVFFRESEIISGLFARDGFVHKRFYVHAHSRNRLKCLRKNGNRCETPFHAFFLSSSFLFSVLLFVDNK